MEIIHLVLGKANPNRMNGVNKVVYELATRQTFAGEKVAVWGITKSITKDDIVRPFKLKVFNAYRNKFRLDPNFIKALENKKDKIVVHIHGSWIPTFFSTSRWLKKLNIPYIVFPHGGYNTVAQEKSSWTKKVYFFLFEKKVLQNAKKVHCIGESEVLGLEKLGIKNKAVLLPYGFQANDMNIDVPKNENFTYCFMGRMDSHTKGLDLILSAFERVLQSDNKVELYLIGEGDDSQKLMQTAVEKGISNSITFFGARYGQEKFEIMSKSNVFLHPSRNEGLPSAIFEAASLSLPIIASKATNFGDAIQKNKAGWVIENADANALYEAMMDSLTLSEDSLHSKGRFARLMLENDYNWETILNQYSTMYQDAFKE